MDSLYRRIHEVIARIPAGTVATYGQVAELAGNPRAARAVSRAMYGAPRDLRLPCHRVVNRAGSLAPAGAFGGREVQRAMLEAEGVTFLPDGRIDMKAHLWDPALS